MITGLFRGQYRTESKGAVDTVRRGTVSWVDVRPGDEDASRRIKVNSNKRRRPGRYLQIIALMVAAVWTAAGQGSRPVKDDVGFCWNPVNMRRFVDYLASSEPAPAPAAPAAPAFAAILPHDDYLYAGRVAYPFVKNFTAREVLIFGVTHGAVRREIGDPRGVIILNRHAAWRGLGRDVDDRPLAGGVARRSRERRRSGERPGA